MTTAHFPTAQAAAQRLLAAREQAAGVPFREILPADRAGAFAIQDATVATLGAIGGWKVGAKAIDAQPACAPLPASGILPTGAVLQGPRWRLRGVELEVAFRLGRDLDPQGRLLSRAEIAAAIDHVLPVIEVVETRLADWRQSDPLASLADLQSHGALVLGAPAAVAPETVDLRQLEAYLAFDGQAVASARGANPAADVWRLLAWLALHCSERGVPLRAGQIITTGSCTGMLFAPEGAAVLGQLAGIGQVELRL
jgi:2-keto-4-pentenoate hydratase